MREIDPSHVKEISFTRALVIHCKLNTKKLFVVLECFKDRAFDSADCFCLFVIPLAHKLFETFVFSPLSSPGVKAYFHKI